MSFPGSEIVDSESESRRWRGGCRKGEEGLMVSGIEGQGRARSRGARVSVNNGTSANNDSFA